MNKLCINCKKIPMAVIKWGLCRKCYLKFRKDSPQRFMKSFDDYSRISNKSEIDFVKNYFKHQNWFYLPARFSFNGLSYQPDFYDGERNVFIEVSGTRQAFHQNKEKYTKFKLYFPKIKLEVRYADGTLLNLDKAKFLHSKEKRPITEKK